MQEWVAGAASLVEWLIAWLQGFWPAIVATAGVVAAVWVTLHVAQHKRDARAAAGDEHRPAAQIGKCCVQGHQWLSRVTGRGSLPTRKSRSAPLSACISKLPVRQ